MEETMKVIWKRPDGFHNASPSDYITVDIASNAKIWLHKMDQENFPFRISSDWQEEETTIKLNRLVNLLNKPTQSWLDWLQFDFNHSKTDNLDLYLNTLTTWLTSIEAHLKGDTWEIDIMQSTIAEIKKKLLHHREKLEQQLHQ